MGELLRVTRQRQSEGNVPEQAGAIVLASDSAAVIQHQKQEHERDYNVQLSLMLVS